MRKIDTKNKLKVFVLVAIIILMIGYTIVTATLILTKKNPVNYFNIKIADEGQDTPSGNSNNNSNGNSNHYYPTNPGKNNNNSDVPEDTGHFNVHYVSSSTSPKITGGSGTATISDDGKTASFYINSIMNDNDTVYIKYDVYNDSDQYNADLDIELTNSNPNYFRVTKQIDKKTIKEKEKTTVTFTVELIKVPIHSEETTSVTGKIIAKPVKK